MAKYLTCPFCGFEFDSEDTLCHHGCPLGPHCQLIRGPNCQYEYAERPAGVRWIRNLFRKRPHLEETHPELVTTARELDAGASATVMCIGGTRESRKNSLAVFGLVPGAEITVLQQRPECVLRVGETELALDADIARLVLVKRKNGVRP